MYKLTSSSLPHQVSPHNDLEACDKTLIEVYWKLAFCPEHCEQVHGLSHSLWVLLNFKKFNSIINLCFRKEDYLGYVHWLKTCD